MARRRSQNRRRSRKSMNNPELDQDSELIDTNDPLWWDYIKDRFSVHESRASSYANTTEQILNNDSVVDSTNLSGEWWNKLEKSTIESSRKVPARRSIRSANTPRESLNSDTTEENSIKKRKVLLGAREKKNIGVEPFLAALDDSSGNTESAQDKKSKINEKKRRSEVDDSRIAETSPETSTDIDVIVKTRPKPFKKRFTKIPDGLFDDLPGPSSRSNAVESSPSKSPVREKTPMKLSDLHENELMGPPKSASHRKRLSSVTRKLNLTSDDSDDKDEPLKKRRLGLAKKKKDFSTTNPFDGLMEETLEQANDEKRSPRKNDSSTTTTTTTGLVNLEKTNRGSLSPIEKKLRKRKRASAGREEEEELVRGGLANENSSNRRNEEISEVDDASDHEKSFSSRLTPKILEISLERISLTKKGQSEVNERSEEEENSEKEEREKENSRIRTLRSTRRIIEDSAYELPDKERSATPQITESENDDERSFRRDHPASTVSSRDNSVNGENQSRSRVSAITNEPRASASRKSRTNYSATKIFIDEDISIEESIHVGRRNESLVRNFLENQEIGTSGKSLASESKSREIDLSDVSYSDDEPETSEKIPTDSRTNVRTRERSSISRKSATAKESRGSVEPQNKSNSKLLNSRLNENSRKSEKSIAKGHSRRGILSDEGIDEAEEDNTDEKIAKKSSNSRLNENSRKFEKIIAKGHSHRGILSDESIDEAEEENTDEKIAKKSSNSRLNENSRKSEKSIAKGRSHRGILSEESSEEAEKDNTDEKIAEKSSNSRLNENSRKSEKRIAKGRSHHGILSDESIDEAEEDNTNEKIAEKSSNFRLNENSRKSEKSIAKGHSHRGILSEESSDESEEENSDEKIAQKSSNSRLNENSRKSEKSIAKGHSDRGILSDESIDEAEEENTDEKIAKKSSNSRLNENSRKSGKIIAKGHSHRGILSDESSDEAEGEKYDEKIAEKSSNSRLNENSRKSEKRIAKGRSHHGILSDESIDEAEEDNTNEKIAEKSSNFRLNENSRKSEKSIAKGHSHRGILSEESSDEAEEENTDEKIAEKSSNSRLNENSRKSGKIIAKGNSHRGILPDESSDEAEGENNDEKIAEKSSNSRLNENSRKSEKRIAKGRSHHGILSDESIDEAEEENTDEKIAKKSSNSRLNENSRKSGKIIAKGHSHRGILSEESSDEAEEDNTDEKIAEKSSNSRLNENSRKSGKIIAKRQSQRIIPSHGSNREDKKENTEKTDEKSLNLRLKEKLEFSEKNVARNKSQEIIEPDESISEDGEENSDDAGSISRNSRSIEKSRKSLASEKTQKNLRINEIVSEDESQDIQETKEKSQNPRANEKSRISRKMMRIARNKSRRHDESDENIRENEFEEAREIDENSRTVNKSRKSRASKESQKNLRINEIVSEDESQDIQETNEKSQNPRANEKSRKSRMSLAPMESQGKDHSDESISEDDVENIEKSSSGLTRDRILKISEKKAENMRKSFLTTRELRTDDKIFEKSISRSRISRQAFEHDDILDENEYGKNRNSSIARKTIDDAPSSSTRFAMRNVNSKNPAESSLAGKRNSNAVSTTISSKQMSSLAADSSKNENSRLIRRLDDSKKQKNITDFFSSRILQKPANSIPRETTGGLDKEKLRIAMEKMKEIKKRELKLMNLGPEAKTRDENLTKRPADSPRRKIPSTRERGKSDGTARVIDKAYIVNGTVYKRPRLPRPKSWATNRLYRHLWKLMEPKFDLSTRVKSEKFVLYLSEVVALTTRRKKYENYKDEVDDLMREMARLGIIKTRNDFYDFCYDFLPYDFRVKVTPILLPGNISTIPYDPKLLHVPII